MSLNLKNLIQSIDISDEERKILNDEFKTLTKQNTVLEFKFNRTLVDKSAITNILNASMAEIEKQKEIIENSRKELNDTLVEVNNQRDLIEQKNNKLNVLLEELKQTQRQLILSEKMASLGELTAGIAHEIQNPLNFVNNFAEVSCELIVDIDEEMSNGDMEEVKAILVDIKGNLEKISSHGKRAGSIVKGMLQHSRKNTGEKELTNLNELADEYLNLAYHGLRAKDNTFNCSIETKFDPNITDINIVPQEIGRVILNIINNAFYAVNKKQKNEKIVYEPKVKLTTAQQNKSLSIEIEDNGGGMPKKIIDKIFQPFFTTKPTGQGTGLGLSMSYDIVKAHGGELKVESEEGRGTVFKIILPVAQV